MKLAIGADHRGFAIKEYIKKHITEQSDDIVWLDVGAFNDERSDYPVFAKAVAQALVDGEVEGGVLLCGSGAGVAMGANRFKGIYAALVWNDDLAREAKEHDHANVLALPADYISGEQAVSMIRTWLGAQELNGRYQERVDMLDMLP
ncbi:MAG TPA: RpiB/LacA/LacB family sugar-phosphate isomerase [Candidatus Dependentiae bacterium]|nr:RpiB/LacA/LacB family sugar-phosphate isomerase [Candidatus Dependentiae bacterium]HRQ62441.1 RpiB/LacA/LacB family sugar-phosphate isomerase [Candidatus Dependentiae bacterium]